MLCRTAQIFITKLGDDMKKGIIFVCGMFIAFAVLSAPNAKNLKVISLFGDNMLLQRNMRVPIWGAALPGGTVEIKFNGQTKQAKVGKNGEWKTYFDPMKAGGPYEMTIAGEKNLKFKNILIGDVWICSGQSNMGMWVCSSKNAQKEISEADYPEIRLFQLKGKVSDKPLKTLEGRWRLCTPSSVEKFSAAAYFFGRDLYKSLNVPIGLIQSSRGASAAEAWTTMETLESDPAYKPFIENYKKVCKDKKVLEKIKEYMEHRRQQILKQNLLRSQFGKKRRKTGCTWGRPGFDSNDWKTMEQPGGWQKDMKNFEGIADFIKEVEIPSDWAGKDLIMSLGAIDECDIAFFNGNEIGSIGFEAHHYWEIPRKYTIPGGLVNPGKSIIAVKIVNEVGAGGFTGKPGKMFLQSKGGGKKIPLVGVWKYKVEKELKRPERLRRPYGPGHHNAPSVLYNAKIHPIIPYAIKGVIWYQGESNAGRAYQYRKLLPAMIKDWRKNWQQGNFTFLIVQLANYMTPSKNPESSAWAELREAQTMTAKKLPNCGLALAIDIGEAKNIHPKNKQDVGRRLALAARKIAYGQDIVYAGPEYESMKIDDNKIIVKFKNAGSGLIAKDGPLKQFAIAGKDRIFKWANAEIKGNSVVVWSDKVKVPVAVRYAWANNPAGCNLYNKEGLPANPFRTDDWPGITANKR